MECFRLVLNEDSWDLIGIKPLSINEIEMSLCFNYPTYGGIIDT